VLAKHEFNFNISKQVLETMLCNEDNKSIDEIREKSRMRKIEARKLKNEEKKRKL